MVCVGDSYTNINYFKALCKVGGGCVVGMRQMDSHNMSAKQLQNTQMRGERERGREGVREGERERDSVQVSECT